MSDLPLQDLSLDELSLVGGGNAITGNPGTRTESPPERPFEGMIDVGGVYLFQA